MLGSIESLEVGLLGHAFSYLLTLTMFIWRMRNSYGDMRRRYNYCVFVRRLVTMTDLYEQVRVYKFCSVAKLSPHYCGMFPAYFVIVI